MNLTEFFNIIRKYGDASFSIPVLKAFLTTPSTPDLTNFFDLYKQDKKLASAVDSKKYAKVIGKILEDHKFYGGDPATITSALQKNPDKMTISSMDIRNVNIPSERMHKFTINVSGILLYDVVEKIYDFAKESEYILDMEIPSAKNQKLGLTDTITLYSSNENLYSTLIFLEKVKSVSNSFGDQPKYREDRELKPFYAEVVEGIAYDSYNSELGKWSRDIVGETIIEAIDNMIVNFVADHFELYGEVDYVNYKNNRVKFIRDMMEQGIDVYIEFNSYLEEGLNSKNVDPDNIYLSDSVREKFIGPRITVSDRVEEGLGEPLDLEAAIEMMTEELLGKSGDSQEGEEEQVTPEDIADYTSEHEEEVIEDGLNPEGASGGVEEDLNLTEDGGDEFVPLTSQIEKVDLEGTTKILELNPANLPLNPLEYVTPPNPTANLRRLDELNLRKDLNSSLEQDLENVGEQQLEGGEQQENLLEEGNSGDELASVLEQALENIEGQSLEIEEQPEIFFDEGNSGDELASDLEQKIEITGEQPLEEGDRPEIYMEEGILKYSSKEGDEGAGPEEVFAGEQAKFGENITVPSEGEALTEEDLNQTGTSGDEEVMIDEHLENIGDEEKVGEQPDSTLGSVFGSEFLSDLMREAGELVIEEEGITEGQDSAKESKENGEPADDLAREEDKNARDVVLPEQPEPKENPEMSLLRQYQERRAAEIAEMESGENKAELMRLMETHISDRPREISQEVRPGEDYLDKLLESAQNGTAAQEDKSEKLEIEGTVEGEETSVGVKSASIEKGDAERYLDSVLEQAQKVLNGSVFSGFDTNMIPIEDRTSEVADDLTPSAVFEDNIAKVEAREEEKSPAEKRIDAMIAALEEKRHKKSSVPMEEETRTPYKRVKSAQEEAMDQRLKEAMEAPTRENFDDFDASAFNVVDSQVETRGASELLGLSSTGAYNAYASNRPTSEVEERYDAMLRGEYSEAPAVVIEEVAPVTAVKREVSAEDERMTKMLENLGKTPPAIVGEYEHIERPVYQQVTSDKERELDELMKNALVPKEPILGSIKDEMTGATREQTKTNEKESYLDNLLDLANNPAEAAEFTGFSAENLGDQIDYLEVASNPQDLFAMVVQEETEKNNAPQGTSVENEQEAYLENLLDSLYVQADGEEADKEKALEEEATPVSYVHVPSEEEMRLAALEQQALQPPAPILEDKQEEAKSAEVAVTPKEEVNPTENYLDSLLDLTSGDQQTLEENPSFGGFDGDMLGGTAIELAGPQGLIEQSLEDKIQQVAEMEKRKTFEERRMDAMIRGEVPEKPTIVLEDALMTPPPQGQEQGAQESYIEGLFKNLEEVTVPEGEEVGFTGFGAEMLEGTGSEAVRTAQDLFSEDVNGTVSQIVDVEVQSEKQEQYLTSILQQMEGLDKILNAEGSEGLLEALEEEVEDIPREKESGEEQALDGGFTGFGSEEVFFDDEVAEQTEEGSLAAAMAGLTFTSLDSVEGLTQEEQTALLHMDILKDDRIDSYRFLYGDNTDEIMNTVIVDNTGREMRVVDYLEENNVLTLLPEDAQLLVNGEYISRDDFISNILVPDLISNKCVSLFDYINENEIDVKYPEQQGGFFKGI